MSRRWREQGGQVKDGEHEADQLSVFPELSLRLIFRSLATAWLASAFRRRTRGDDITPSPTAISRSHHAAVPVPACATNRWRAQAVISRRRPRQYHGPSTPPSVPRAAGRPPRAQCDAAGRRNAPRKTPRSSHWLDDPGQDATSVGRAGCRRARRRPNQAAADAPALVAYCWGAAAGGALPTSTRA